MKRHPLLGGSSSSGQLSNYAFKGSAGSAVQHYNKQNVGLSRNRERERDVNRDANRDREQLRQKDESTSRRKPIFMPIEKQQPAFTNQFAQGVTSKGSERVKAVPERASSAEVRVLSSLNIANMTNMTNRMAQSHLGKEELGSGRSRKKSVRFSEQSLEVVQKFDHKKNLVRKDPKQKPETHRNRSNSILKNKMGGGRERINSSSSSVFKGSQRGKEFSISEYKNTIVRERYNQLMRYYGKKGETQPRATLLIPSLSVQYSSEKGKYNDSGFQPVPASISKSKTLKVKWVRLSELFKNKKKTILRKSDEPSKTVVMKEVDYQGMNASVNFLHLVSLMKGSASLLSKIFESASYNESGLYMLKIFQSHEWKCVIVDDFIPVVEEAGRVRPLFTGIRQQSDDELELWPLLLEKAYASVLGSYQAVHGFNLMGYFCEMMGLPLHRVDLANEKKGWQEELRMTSKDSIVFGYSKLESAGKTEKEPKRIVLSYEGTEEKRKLSESAGYESLLTKTVTRLFLPDLKRVFSELFIVKMGSLQYYTSAHIVNPSRFGQNIKNKRCFIDSQLSVEGSRGKLFEVKREKPMVRSFQVSSNQEVSLILKRKGSEPGSPPLWLRMFLFMKELDSYRWVEGRYACQCISFSAVLQPGEYFVVIMPDWTAECLGELTLMLYSRVQPLQIESCSEGRVQGIIEKGCSDYAQRFGGMAQVNKWICTYSMVDLQAGLMIENINNERRHGKVKIFRSINNLKPKGCHLLPLNDEFYGNGQIKNEVEICMSREESYTVILMLFGGKDAEFLNTFSFGG